MNSLKGAVALALFAGIAAASSAAPVGPPTLTIEQRVTDTPDMMAYFNGFDSRLGTLTSVTLRYSFTFDIDSTISNYGDATISEAVAVYGNAQVFGHVTGYERILENVLVATPRLEIDPYSSTPLALSDLSMSGEYAPWPLDGYLDNPVYFSISSWVTLGNQTLFGDIFPQSQKASFVLAYDYQAVAPVPEAATWAMMIAGFGAVGTRLRRRRVAVNFG